MIGIKQENGLNCPVIRCEYCGQELSAMDEDWRKRPLICYYPEKVDDVFAMHAGCADALEKSNGKHIYTTNMTVFLQNLLHNLGFETAHAESTPFLGTSYSEPFLVARKQNNEVK